MRRILKTWRLKTKNITAGAIAVLSILGYGFVVFAAGPFAPGRTIDPVADFPSDCSGPLDTDCFVTTGWTLDTVDNTVYNTTDMIGIGTDTPTHALTVAGDLVNILEIGGDASYLANDDGNIFGEHGVIMGFNSVTTGWNNYFYLHDSVVQMGLYNDLGNSAAGISMDYDVDGNAKIYMSTDNADEPDAGSLYHNANIQLDESGVLIGAYRENDNIYSNWFNNTANSIAKLEIGAGYMADPANPTTESSGASYIDIWYDKTPGNLTEYFMQLGVTERGLGGDLTFNDRPMLALTTDYNVLLGAVVTDQSGSPTPVPTYSFLPSTDLATLTGLLEPVTTKNESSQDFFSALVYAPDHRNLFFWTDPAGAQTGTGDWEPVSPFERDPVTNEVYLYDPTDTVGIGVVPSNGDRLEVFGDIRVGTSASNGCLKDFSGGTITGTCSSDERLKTNIIPVTDVLNRLANIDVVTYDWNDVAQDRGFRGDTQQLGVLAQNVEGIFPDLVVTDRDGYKQVNYARLPLLTLQAVRELNEKITNNVSEFFAHRIRTDELCIGNTCLNEAQINAILDATQTTPSPSPAPTPAPTPNPDPNENTSPDPEPEPVPAPETIPEPEPAPVI